MFGGVFSPTFLNTGVLGVLVLTTGDVSLLSSLLTSLSSFSLPSAACLTAVVFAVLTVVVTGDDDDDDDGARLTTGWEAWDWTDVVGNTLAEVTAGSLAC